MQNIAHYSAPSWVPSPWLAASQIGTQAVHANTFRKVQKDTSGFPGDSVLKNLPASAGDAGDAHLTSGSKRSPGGRNGNPLQSSCLENLMNREAWQATVHRIAKARHSWARMHTQARGHQQRETNIEKGHDFRIPSYVLTRSLAHTVGKPWAQDANKPSSSHLLLLPSCLRATSSRTSDDYSCASSLCRCHDICEAPHSLQMTSSNLGDL